MGGGSVPSRLLRLIKRLVKAYGVYCAAHILYRVITSYLETKKLKEKLKGVKGPVGHPVLG